MEYYNEERDRKITPLTAEMCKYFDAPEYLINGVFAYGEIACLFGAPGAGKSLLALYIAYMISIGGPISGFRTKKEKVLYLAYEDFSGIAKRVAGLLGLYGPTDNLFLTGEVGNLYEQDEDGFSVATQTLRKYVRDNQIQLVIIDTLSSAFYGIEENDNKSMNRVVERAKYLTEWSGAAVIIVHHNTKADSSTPRGHGVLLGALDLAIQVRQPGPGNIEAKFTKIKNSSVEAPLHFKIHVENIGNDVFDDPVTAAVCKESDVASEAKTRSKAELAALRVLDELQQSGPVLERDWLAACATGNRVSGASLPPDRLRAARRVIQTMKEEGWVVALDGFVSRAIAST